MKWDEVCSVKDDIQWRNIDLNLLVTFSYLYRYRSVSLAAEKSFVSQSAMSHSLSRLRVLFDDPLFERKGHKMDQPSTRIILRPRCIIYWIRLPKTY